MNYHVKDGCLIHHTSHQIQFAVKKFFHYSYRNLHDIKLLWHDVTDD